jgi:hypothetical protein
MARAPPSGCQLLHGVADPQRHPYRAFCGVVARDRVIEEHHDPVAREPLEGAFVGMDEGADGPVVLGEHAHHLLRLAGLRERREVPQVAERHDDLAPVTPQQALVANDEIGQLGREETP